MATVFDFLIGDSTYALYAANGTSSNGLTAYFLTTVATPSQSPLTFQETWQGYNGAYLFAAPLTLSAQDLPGLASQLNLQSTSSSQRIISWVQQSGGAFTVQAIQCLKSSSDDTANVNNLAAIAFGNISLSIQIKTLVQPNFGDLTLEVQNNKGLTFERTGQAGGGIFLTLGAYVLFDLANDRFGAFSFDADQWDSQAFLTLFRDDFFAASSPWGGELRYFYGEDSPSQLVYPVIAPFQYPPYSFNASAHPLLPNDASQTAFIFKPGSLPSQLASAFGRGIIGESIPITPLEGFGFYMASRPKLPTDTSNLPAYVYLAPVGKVQVGTPGSVTPITLMCGLSGLEFLKVTGGDVLEFVPGQAAFAKTYGVSLEKRKAKALAGEPNPDLLAKEYTTSWVRYLPAALETDAPELRGYYSQPNGSVNYGIGSVSVQISFPTPVAAFVQNPGEQLAANPGLPVWPMVFYGGVFPSDPSQAPDWVNQGVAGGDFHDFEKNVLTQVRPQQILAGVKTATVFQDNTGQALAGRTATRQGLLVQLNDATTLRARAVGDAPANGTWESLILARKDDQVLSIDADASGVVDKVLSSALSNNQIFAVLNNWAVFDQMHDTITIEAFTFRIRPPDNDPNTLLVFKYDSTRSLVELISSPEAWSETAHLCPNVALAQKVLNQMWEVALKAQHSPHDPFVQFRAMAQLPAWTGTLCVNAPVSGSSPDLQMIFDGIDGPLSAHHFGIELNQIQRTKPEGAAQSQPDIERSSMFGAIYYEAKPSLADVLPPDFDFSVRELVVGIQNSAVTQFNTTVGMTIGLMFGRTVALIPSPPDAANRLDINGKYQLIDNVGTVSFGLPPGAVPYFDFKSADNAIRVIDQFKVTGATLVRVDDTPSKGEGGSSDTSLKSRFSLNGEILFVENPFPGVNLDLYTYGNATFGAPMQGLAFDITTTHTGGVRQVKIEPNYAGITVAPNVPGMRPTGLVSSLPLKLTAFIQNEKGLDPKALGGSPVSAPQLLSKNEEGQPQVNYLSTKPTYALQFDLPLGALGSLSDVQVSLNAGLILGWGPSDSTPDNDGATVYVLLPQLSAGVLGFSLQGLIRTTFGDANLVHVGLTDGSAVYALLFNNVALSIYGITLPPNVIIDFILFADPGNPTNSNLAWCLAAAQPSKTDTYFTEYRLGAVDDPIVEAKTIAELAKALDDVYGFDWPLSFPDHGYFLAEMWALPIHVVKGITPTYRATATQTLDFAGQPALAGTVQIDILADLETLQVLDIQLQGERLAVPLS